MYLYLIRHGRTVWNDQGRLQGWQDSPLNDEGITSAQLTAKALSDVPFCACYTSLAKRAYDTADIILADRHLSPVRLSGLNEMNFGSWEGRLSVDLAQLDEYQQFRHQPHLYQAISNQGESTSQLLERITDTLDDIISRHHDGEHILIVSHGITLTLLTAMLRGVDMADFRDESVHPFIKNTTINIVHVQDGHATLTTHNDDKHLP